MDEIPDSIEIGRDKLNDPIKIEIKNPKKLGKDGQNFSYIELMRHFRERCPYV